MPSILDVPQKPSMVTKGGFLRGWISMCDAGIRADLLREMVVPLKWQVANGTHREGRGSCSAAGHVLPSAFPARLALLSFCSVSFQDTVSELSS